MARTTSQAERDIAQVRELPFGQARTRAAEAEVDRLQAEGPADALPFGLFALVEAYTFSAEAARSFVPFTQMLRLFDDHPEYFDSYDRHSVFWAYKWMVGDLIEFPEVPAAQIEQTLADMRQRYALAGNGMNAVRLMEFWWAWHRRDPDTEQHYQAWVATPRDDFSQCESCEPGDRAAYLASTGRPLEAIELIEQTLATNPRCGTEPADMLSVLALAYLDAGRLDEAPGAYYRSVAELAQSDGHMVAARGRHLEFLTRAGHPERAIRALVGNEAMMTGGCGVPGLTLGFLLRAGACARTWMEHGWGGHTVALRTLGPMTVAQFHQWARAKASVIADALDARNGNDTYNGLLRERFDTPLPVTPVGLSTFRHAPGTVAAPDALVAPVPDAVPSDTSPTSDPPAVSFTRAEFLARRDPAQAAGQYQVAALGFAAAGDTERAGYANAEAAHCAQVVGDLESAVQGYEKALSQLGAIKGPVELAPIAMALIAALADQGTPASLERAAHLTQHYRDAVAGCSPDTAHRDGAARALLDTHARVLATQGHYDQAVDLAREASNAWLTDGQEVAAASGMVLAGRILARELARPGEAEPLLRRAVEAYATRATTRDALMEAAGILIELLQDQGRTQEAQQVADGLP